MNPIRTASKLALATLVVLAFSLVGASVASAQEEVQHGISFTKGCTSPVNVGAPYSCTFTVRNNIDDAHDTLTIHSLSDTVHAASGDVVSGNIFGSLKLDNGGTSATCTAAGGSGSAANPWHGATVCTLPFGSRIDVQSTSHYTVAAGDYALPNHRLTDDALLGWNDKCDDPADTGNSNCNMNPPTEGAGSSAIVHAVITVSTKLSPGSSVVPGTVVTDQATLAGSISDATGTVTYSVYSDDACQALVQHLGTKTVTAGVVGPSDPFAATAGNFWFQAVYSGDATHLGGSSPCTSEPLTVTTSPSVSVQGSTTVPATTAPPTTVAASAELPRTGGPAGGEVVVALLLLGAGAFLLQSVKRRTHRTN
jgi:hypothetical protein